MSDSFRSALPTLWPQAPKDLLDAILANYENVFIQFAINTPLRKAHFLAQISHESDGGTVRSESLNYIHAERICQVWPSRFPSVADALPFVRRPIDLADKVYNGRMGNRIGTHDGWDYRGRGPMQLTGRDNYEFYGQLCGLDLIGNPDLANDPAHGFTIAAAEFSHSGCLPWADKDDLKKVTRLVNGGLIGYDSRAIWLARWKRIFLHQAPQSAPPLSWWQKLLGAFQ